MGPLYPRCLGDEALTADLLLAKNYESMGAYFIVKDLYGNLNKS